MSLSLAACVPSADSDQPVHLPNGMNAQCRLSIHARIGLCFNINTLKTGKVNPDILTISEDPDEMPHNAAFHQGLHYLLRQNRSSRNNSMNSEIISCDPSMYTMDHPDLIVFWFY